MPDYRFLISARFLCLTEKKAPGMEMGRKKGKNTGKQINSVFNLQFTTFNMTRKI
jgi:hypothetical protein